MLEEVSSSEATDVSLTRSRLVAVCDHCGEDCDGPPVKHEQKKFCCTGCKTVYQILSDHQLDKYYQLQDRPGISQREKPTPSYDFLDDVRTRERLVDFSDGQVARVHFLLPQIHCSACLWLLEQLPKLHQGILAARVQFLRKEIHLQFDERQISLRQLVELLASIGYPPQIQLDKLSEEKSPAVDRSLYKKLAVAGFAFGNIMLFSFPEYLGLDHVVDKAYAHFFGYLNILLIVPVLFYAAGDYWRSAWYGIRQGILNMDVPITLGMMALFGRSLFEILTGSGAGYLDSLAGLTFFLLIGKWYQKKTYHRISFDRDYRSYFPISARVLGPEGSEKSVTLDVLKPGDIISVRYRELIPADATLLEGRALLDYSFVTGEDTPVPKHPEDKIYAGARQVGGSIKLRIEKSASNSYLTQLWNEKVFSKNIAHAQVSSLANRVAKYFTWTILAIASGTLIFWLPQDVSTAMQAFTAVLIVACPCAVALSIPFTFGNILRIFGHHGFYLKNTSVIEAMANLTDVVFDKTGTITSPNRSTIDFKGNPLTIEQEGWIKSLTCQSSHPISQLIHGLYPTRPLQSIQEFRETIGQGIEGVMDGRRVMLGSSKFVGDLPKPQAFDHLNGTHLFVDGSYLGTYCQSSAFRKDLRSVLASLSNYQMHVLTGDFDHQHDRLRQLFDDSTALVYEQSPQDKLQYIRGLQKQGRRVMMIGDGLNDAGALKQSEVGIVITENTNNFTPACDAILGAPKFNLMGEFLRFCKQGIKIVYLLYLVALIYNVIGLTYAVQGLLSPVIAAILMPASSITIVLLGLSLSNLLGRRLNLER